MVLWGGHYCLGSLEAARVTRKQGEEMLREDAEDTGELAIREGRRGSPGIGPDQETACAVRRWESSQGRLERLALLATADPSGNVRYSGTHPDHLLLFWGGWEVKCFQGLGPE